MTHDQKVQQWYNDRVEALMSFRAEADKRREQKEWLAGEDARSFVSDKLDKWVADNPFPRKEGE